MNITNVTSPALKGSVIMITGFGWNGDATQLFLKTKKTELELEIIKQEENVIYFNMPENEFVRGVLRLISNDKVCETYVNEPILDWCLGNKFFVSQKIRIFGKGLCDLNLFERDEQLSNLKENAISVLIKSEKVTYEVKNIKSSNYEISFDCPNLENGKYFIEVIADEIVSNKIEIEIASENKKNDKIYSVLDYGAIADGIKDDSEGINRAIIEASNNGGGIVYIPHGNYLVKNTIQMLPYVTLRGESKNRTWIHTPTGVDFYGERFEGLALKHVIMGDRDFAIENLSVFSVYSDSILMAPSNFCNDMKNSERKDYTHEYCEFPEAKNVRVSNCFFEISHTYRHHYRFGEPFLNDQSPSKHSSWGNTFAVCYRGDDFVFEKSSVRAAGNVMLLKGAQNIRISDNEFYVGSSGTVVWVSPSFIFRKMDETNKILRQPKLTENLVYERNTNRPVSNMAGSCICFMTHSKNAFISNNSFEGSWERDSECMVWHSWGFRIPFDVKSSYKNKITFSKEEAKKYLNHIPVENIYFNKETGVAYDDALVDFDVIIIKGKGIGQKFVVKSNKGNEIVLEGEFKIVPDETSVFVLSEFKHYENNTVVNNRLQYTGPGIYMWGSSYNNIIEGNTLSRTAGIILHDLGGEENILQGWAWAGNYYNRILNNTIKNGRYDGNNNPFWAFYIKRQSIVGNCSSAPYGIGTFGMIIDRNKLSEDSFVSVVADSDVKSHTEGVIVSDNIFNDVTVGVVIGKGAEGVVCGNEFENTLLPFDLNDNNMLISDKKSFDDMIDIILKDSGITSLSKNEKINCRILKTIGICMYKKYKNGVVEIIFKNNNPFQVECYLEIKLDNVIKKTQLKLETQSEKIITEQFDISNVELYEKKVDIYSEYKIGQYCFFNNSFLYEQMNTIKKWNITFKENFDEKTESFISVEDEFIDFTEYDNGKESYWASANTKFYLENSLNSTLVIDFRGPIQQRISDQWFPLGELRLFLNGEEQTIFGNAFRGPYPTYHMEQFIDLPLVKGENIIEIFIHKHKDINKCDLCAKILLNGRIICK